MPDIFSFFALSHRFLLFLSGGVAVVVLFLFRRSAQRSSILLAVASRSKFTFVFSLIFVC